jgi:hypothetical protein
MPIPDMANVLDPRYNSGLFIAQYFAFFGVGLLSLGHCGNARPMEVSPGERYSLP